MEYRPTDRELMLKVHDDDTDALADLMDRYRERITHYLAGLSRDEDLAKDLFQETFIRLWSARKRYLPLAKFSTYLIEIAKNLWLNERPRWQRRMEAGNLDTLTEERPDALQTALADRRSLPEAVLLRKEREQRIGDALETLPPAYQIVFTLSHFEGLKYREIAAMLGIAEGTVKWRMSEATRRLRETLHDLCED